MKAMYTLIEALGNTHPTLAQTLEEWADDYRLDEILAAMELLNAAVDIPISKDDA